MNPSSPDRQRLLDLVRRHGWNATAFQTVGAGYNYFFHGDACVAYVDTGRAWVAAGAPIAAAEAVANVAKIFARAARSAGKRCCFFATEDHFQETTAEDFESFQVGEQPVWDPRQWPATLANHPSLREQLRRARAKGVTVRETRGELISGPLRDALDRVAARWIATHDMAPMGFLVNIQPFGTLVDRACFVAELNGRVCGFASVIPVPARGGWFIEHLIRDPSAPNGTGELLVNAVMQWAKDADCGWLTLGLAPLAGDVSGFLRFTRRIASPLYDFDGLRAYKAKLNPQSWSVIHLTYPNSQSPAISILDVLSAFTRGGFLRFGIRSILRGPTFLLRAIATLLVPWTILLAATPVYPWFGTPYVKWAWVIFDVLLALGLFGMLRRPKVSGMTVLAMAVTCDAALTLLQAVVWNARRITNIGEALIVFVACAGPAFLAVVLWGARARMVRAHRI
ncbi:MAG: DUF2156 domain-containing protein [Polyangiaceae bacterium]|nr:DUF2156 domain-containing protein [Polyangiaceae bacterium]